MSIDETADTLAATPRQNCNTIGENHAGNLTAISVMLKEDFLTVSAFSIMPIGVVPLDALLRLMKVRGGSDKIVAYF